jgi:DNA-directed RNA polymerase subunit beta'
MADTKSAIVAAADEEATKIERQYRRGLVTEEERLRELERIWNDARDVLTGDVEKQLKGQNSVYMMADSGAKGNMNQISQMAGMRGLVLDPQGKIIDIPIKSNYREGLTVLEYFLSTHGARKGLADTAIRTANSGYLTRRLVDVAQDVIVTMDDCGTSQGIWAGRVDVDGKPIGDDEFRSRITGRVLAEDLVNPETGEIIAAKGDELSDYLELEDGTHIDQVQQVMDIPADVLPGLNVRSVMFCEADHGVCAACYGRNLASGQVVGKGEAVGIIAAQSIGEPGTQLTMRTFHQGGVARADITAGLPRVEELFEARQPNGAARLATKPGKVSVEQTDNGRIIRISAVEQLSWRTLLPEDAEVTLTEGVRVEANKTPIALLANGDKILAGMSGEFYLDGRTAYVREEKDDSEEIVVNVTDQILVEDGDEVLPGTQLTFGTKDPHLLLETMGPEAVQQYIIEEVQKVYRSQGVNTNDKHIEVICRQMLRKVQVSFPGDTDLLEGDTIDRFEFSSKNEQVLAQGGEPATAVPLLLGITKASLETDSFLSAASFQETTRVLTEAAINGKVDHLRGLKENVIIGKLIPAGSGFNVQPKDPNALSELEEATLAAMNAPAEQVEPAEEEDYRELMAAGHLAPTAVLERDEDGFSELAPEDAGEVNTADVESESVDEA